MRNDMTTQKHNIEQSSDCFQILKDDYLDLQMSAEQIEGLHGRMNQAKRDNEKKRRSTSIRYGFITAAAVLIMLIGLPNMSPSIAYAMEQIPVLGQFVEVIIIRNYEYKTEYDNAHIETPGIAVEDDDKLAATADEINREIERITENLMKEFEAGLSDEGHQDISVKSEVLTTTSDYFTLKLICQQKAGSGSEWNYYYTIDLTTGERLQLNSLFREGADYITPISDNIKEQMQTQMTDDDTVTYWLDHEVDDWNFKAITEDTDFYLNESGNVVIGFDEGQVAPRYMGTVEFEIPAEVLEDIRK